LQTFFQKRYWWFLWGKPKQSIRFNICFGDDWTRTVRRLYNNVVIHGHLRDSESQGLQNSWRSWLERSLQFCELDWIIRGINRVNQITNWYDLFHD
jgi:hypothetical protein